MNMSSRSQKIRSDLSSILSRITRLTDRQTNRILIARPRLHFMQSGKKLKKIGHVMRHNYLEGHNSRNQREGENQNYRG